MQSQIEKHTLSLLLSERIHEVDWESFSMPEWEFLIQLAQQEGVASLVYWRLSKQEQFSSLPQFVHTSLRTSYASIWVQNQKTLKELELIASRFYEAGIQTVALKGSCYALTIYPDIGLRPMSDLDILVPVSKLQAAVQITQSLGYKDLLPEASHGLRDVLSHEIFLQKPAGIPLEIHYSLIADKTFRYAVPVDWFWKQTEILKVTHSKLYFEGLHILTPTAQLLYAASHAMLQHGGNKTPLCWYYDMDQIVRVYAHRLDWELLLTQARNFEWSSALHAALLQTHAYFDTPLPETVRTRLAMQTDRLSSLVEVKKKKPATHLLEEHQKILSLNWMGRLRLLLALVFPSPAYMRWRYQFQTFWALPYYYLIRWAVILKDGIRTVAIMLIPRSGAD